MPHYYPIWIAAGGHNVVRRGPDCESPVPRPGGRGQNLNPTAAAVGNQGR